MKPININLFQTSSDNFWDNKFLFRIKNNEININLNKNYLDKIQCAANQISCKEIKEVHLNGDLWDLEKIWSFWSGYYNPKQKNNITWSKLSDKEEKELLYRIKAIDWVRNMINLPANKLSPEKLVNETVLLLSNLSNDISFRIIKGEKLYQKKYMGIYKVGCGSKQKPCFLSLDYNPSKKENSSVFACLVGKGITFDTGGYNLKHGIYMNGMKSDMAGAATLVGSLFLAISRGLKKRVKLYLCCAENMISSNSLRVGDIISYRNGKKVEVMNTDAEGRLILADGLINASKKNAQLIIDAATLTGAAKIAVGNNYHAVFTFDKVWLKKLMISAELEKELFWPLPLAEFHRKEINSNFADLSNIPNTNQSASASNAAAFLSYFVKNYKNNWIHIDCSASYQDKNTNKWQAGGTGIGVRTIANLLINN